MRGFHQAVCDIARHTRQADTETSGEAVTARVVPGSTSASWPSRPAALGKIHAVPYGLLTTEFTISLVRGLAAIGRFAEGITLVDETIRRMETKGDVSYIRVTACEERFLCQCHSPTLTRLKWT